MPQESRDQATTYGSSSGLWYLEGVTGEGSIRRVPILALPFQVGRLPGGGLTLSSPMISGRHAEIFEHHDGLRIRDLGSTNGTRVNGERVREKAALVEGDIIHFAKLEFRLGRVDGNESRMLLVETLAVDATLPEPVVARARILEELMSRRAMKALFQPIVDLRSLEARGYEALGRADLEGITLGTAELFKAAAVLGAEAELSRLLRDSSLVTCHRLPTRAALFINTHPVEIGSPELLPSLAAFRRAVRERPVVVEIHEGAVGDLETLRTLRRQLADLDLGLAYDDFGAGQARLLELAEAPPEFLKFDLSMVRGLDVASPGRRKLAARLVSLASELGITTVAEGIETEAEAEACREAGFHLAQGFLFGRPATAGEIEG